MTTTTLSLTAAQIQRNAMEDTREYHDAWIDELSDAVRVSYLHMFMHSAMIGHWATTFNAPISDLIQNFANTPSITIPALADFPPPPIAHTVGGFARATPP